MANHSPVGNRAERMHDGRARSLTEAIRWHGGEGATARDAFIALSDSEQEAVLTFLESL